jgi:Trypsin-co-occurring domain 1
VDLLTAGLCPEGRKRATTTIRLYATAEVTAVPARTIPVRVGDIDLDVEVTALLGTEATSRASKAAEGVVDAFEQARHAIVEIAASMAEVIEGTAARAVRPDHLEIEFGLKISAQGSVIVAGAAAEATLQVKVAYDATRPAPT